jgi:polar amino acid transport system permease protein
MTEPPSIQAPGPILESSGRTLGGRLRAFPWWFLTIILIAIWVAFIISSNEYLFSLDSSYSISLDTGVVSEAFITKLEEYEISLSDRVELSVQEPGKRWKIVDGRQIFFLRLENGALDFSSRGDYGQAFDFIKSGLSITIRTSLISYGIAIIFGLLAGLGRISNNIFINNLSRLYVELIRGIPMLVLIFFIALVGVPIVVDSLNNFGFWLSENGFGTLAAPFTLFDNQAISMNNRAIVALAVTYGAFLAEIFRAGIQSITRGQMEAARSLGMSYGQSMRYVILPQAIRNVLPALGNDFVAMVKDSSLVSVLAVRDITQVARLYAGSTFRFRESYVTLAVMYLTMTVLLSMLVQVVERRLRIDE